MAIYPSITEREWTISLFNQHRISGSKTSPKVKILQEFGFENMTVLDLNFHSVYTTTIRTVFHRVVRERRTREGAKGLPLIVHAFAL